VFCASRSEWRAGLPSMKVNCVPATYRRIMHMFVIRTTIPKVQKAAARTLAARHCWRDVTPINVVMRHAYTSRDALNTILKEDHASCSASEILAIEYISSHNLISYRTKVFVFLVETPSLVRVLSISFRSHHPELCLLSPHCHARTIRCGGGQRNGSIVVVYRFCECD
jgi:hypothetical protein